jgi:K+-sensing histidine kinase KdpD
MKTTTEDALQSKAFQLAVLKSEAQRITGMICLLGALMLFVIIRGFATSEILLPAAQFIVLAFVIVHEALMLRAVRQGVQDETDLMRETWVLNVFIESQIPTIALFLLLASGWLSPYQVLVAPAVLLYFLLIILSTLRLSPTLTALTGVLSAVGYLFVTFYTGMKFQNADAAPIAYFLIYAGLILTGGILAAVVAGRIRKHVGAALREAELKNKLEQVNHDLDIARSIQQGLLPG